MDKQKNPKKLHTELSETDSVITKETPNDDDNIYGSHFLTVCKHLLCLLTRQT